MLNFCCLFQVRNNKLLVVAHGHSTLSILIWSGKLSRIGPGWETTCKNEELYVWGGCGSGGWVACPSNGWWCQIRTNSFIRKKNKCSVFLEKQKQKKEAKATTWFLISSHLTCQFFLNLNPKTSLRSPSWWPPLPRPKSQFAHKKIAKVLPQIKEGT